MRQQRPEATQPAQSSKALLAASTAEKKRKVEESGNNKPDYSELESAVPLDWFAAPDSYWSAWPSLPV